MNIPFHIPTPTTYFEQSGISPFEGGLGSRLPAIESLEWLRHYYSNQHIYFTKSCSQSLELAISSLQLKPGSEVIIPSFGFVSLANAVSSNGLKCVFADCEVNTMNIDPRSIEEAIGPATRAVISINYGGIPCDYEKIIPLCKRYGLVLIEDNAHGILSRYQNVALGSFGDVACFSFDHMKNISCFEGGAISFKDEKYLNRFLQISELGTNRFDFTEGKVSRYEWVTVGTNTRLAEPLKSILYGQFLNYKQILGAFQTSWLQYHSLVTDFNLPIVHPKTSGPIEHNGYLFWIRPSSQQAAHNLVLHLQQNGIDARFHYTPLHSSTLGKQIGVTRGPLQNTENLAATLIRLPLFYSIERTQIERVCVSLAEFYR